MQTYSAHFGVRVEQHDQTIPAPGISDRFSVIDCKTPGKAVAELTHAVTTRVSQLQDNPEKINAAELGLYMEAASVALDAAAAEFATWPGFFVLEDADQYGKVTARLWLTVTNWAEHVDILEAENDAN